MNPALLQKQLKDNANDLQDFCKDLKSWGEEMKRKEQELKKKDDTPKKVKVQTEKIENKVKGVSTGATDYIKWEKFNAELECERLEDDIKDDSELTDEFEETPKDEALLHKEKGNSYVKAKEWDKAIECYTKAIKCYSFDPVFYANRALCHLKNGNYEEAEGDCTLSLRLDGTYVKAFQRRAAARENLGKLEMAKEDLEQVLIYEPKNKESKVVLDNIRKKMNLQPKLLKDEQRPVSKFTASKNKLHTLISTTTNQSIKSEFQNVDTSVSCTSSWPDVGCEISPVKSIEKPPHLRSKKHLKRVQITEIDGFLDSKIESVQKTQIIEPQAIAKHVIENVKKDIDENVQSKINEPIEKISSFKKKREQLKNEENEKLRDDLYCKSLKLTYNETCKKKLIIENTPKDIKNTENFFITRVDSKVENVSSKENLQTPEELLSIPKTSVQFFNTWKNLKIVDEKFSYLKIIQPSDLPKIFQDSLEINMFSSILEVLSTCFIENKEDMYEYLFNLTKVKRFSAFTIFMDSTDKNRLWKIITYLRNQGKWSKEEIDNLVLKYEL